MGIGMKIGELSALTGCNIETIRFYEREGLLPAPARSENNYRRYNASHVERLIFIRHCRSLDMGLDDIRTLMKIRDRPEESCSDVNALLDNRIEHVARRIKELQSLQAQLVNLRWQCCKEGLSKECAILQELATDASAKS